MDGIGQLYPKGYLEDSFIPLGLYLETSHSVRRMLLGSSPSGFFPLETEKVQVNRKSLLYMGSANALS